MVASEGMLWELSPWLSGRPVTNPTTQQTLAGMRALAQLHRAWGHRDPTFGSIPVADLPTDLPTVADIPSFEMGRGTVAVLRERLEFARQCTKMASNFDWTRLAGENSHLPWAVDIVSFVSDSSTRMSHLVTSLSEWVERIVPQQPVLRDIWSDHLFFADEGVSGLIDFHAVGVGTVAGDIGRLLASWNLPAEHSGWQEAVAEYESIRPLEELERKLVVVLDDAARVLTPWVWLNWVLLERRNFPMRKMNSRVTWSLQRFFAR